MRFLLRGTGCIDVCRLDCIFLYSNFREAVLRLVCTQKGFSLTTYWLFWVAQRVNDPESE